MKRLSNFFSKVDSFHVYEFNFAICPSDMVVLRHSNAAAVFLCTAMNKHIIFKNENLAHMMCTILAVILRNFLLKNGQNAASTDRCSSEKQILLLQKRTALVNPLTPTVAWMSKITNDGLTLSGTGMMLYSWIHMETVGVKGLTIWLIPSHNIILWQVTEARYSPRNKNIVSFWHANSLFKIRYDSRV